MDTLLTVKPSWCCALMDVLFSSIQYYSYCYFLILCLSSATNTIVLHDNKAYLNVRKRYCR